MDVKLPNGMVIQNVPEGTTKTDLRMRLLKLGIDPNAPAPAVDPTEGMSWLDKAKAGAGKSFYDTARGAGQLLGLVSQSDIDEAKALDVPLMKTGGGITGNIVGGAAQFLPTAMIPGAGTVTGGALAGATFGALQPTATGESMAKNVLTGGIAGAAVPAAVRAYRGSKAFLEPLYEGGRKQIAGRVLRRAAGDRADDIVARMRQPKELVPGSRPTVAEVADDANIAALQRTVSAKTPSPYTQRAEMNNLARVRALNLVEGDKAAAELARKQSTAGLQRLVTTSDAMADPKPVAGLIQKIINANPKREQLVSQLSAVKDSLLDDAGKFGPQRISDLRSASQNIADMMAAKGPTGAKVNEAIVRELSIVKKSLDRAIAKAEPAYGKFLKAYADASTPVDRAKIVQQIKKAALSQTEDTLGQPTLRAGPFAKSLRDLKDVSRKATGFKRADPQRYFSPQQMQALQSIRSDLARSQRGQNLGRGIGSDTYQKFATANILEQAGVPTLFRKALQVPGNLAGRVGQAVYGDADDQMANYLARILLNPQEAAGVMAAAPALERQALIRALQYAPSVPVGISQGGE